MAPYRSRGRDHRSFDEEEEEISAPSVSDEDLNNSEWNSQSETYRKKSHFFELVSGNAGNRVLDDNNITEFLQALTVDNDELFAATYRKGILLSEFEPTAFIADIGIHYVPGADLAQVNILENGEITFAEPIQKSARWKVLTAGSLLVELEVQRDLSMKTVDITSTVIATHKANQKKQKAAVAIATEGVKDLMKQTDETAISISSDYVTILNSFSNSAQFYDLKCTCIEVDGTSLLNLIHNFRDLINTQGEFARFSPEATVKILETMIEDARRLLVRSPILTRVAQRLVIQKSKYTRYGVDNGTMFYTFTTSRGVAEMIQQGVGYYSSLQNSKEAQAKIRPPFMQMIVFLLSLLNNDDLERLRPALEKTYDLKADRQSIELTILKVLTYYAVGPYLFLGGILSALYGKRCDVQDDMKSQSALWDVFLGSIGRLGWILPGTMDVVGRDPDSWKVKWQKYTDSDIFDHLQYYGEKDAVNKIPSLKVSSEALAHQEVQAEFQNGKSYNLSAKYLDSITLAIKDNYVLLDPETKLMSDLIITEEELFKELYRTSEELEIICSSVNNFLFTHRPSQKRNSQSAMELETPQKSQRRGISLYSKAPKPPKPKKRLKMKMLSVPKPSGRRTKSTISIVSSQSRREQVVALSWKLNGRKITYKDLVKGVGTDLNVIHNTLDHLRKFTEYQQQLPSSSSFGSTKKLADELAQNIRILESRLKPVEELRTTMLNSHPDKDDEPILRVHFPNQIHWTQDLPWCDYTQKFDPHSTKLFVTSERYTVVEPPKWTANVAELKLKDGPIATVTPLTDIGEDERYRN